MEENSCGGGRPREDCFLFSPQTRRLGLGGTLLNAVSAFVYSPGLRPGAPTRGTLYIFPHIAGFAVEKGFGLGIIGALTGVYK